MAVAAASNVPSMLLFSYILRPSSIGGLSCSPGNFNAPLVVSDCLRLLMIARLAFHAALDWNRGGSAFCTAYTSAAVRDSATAGVICGTVPAEATSDVMMPVG